MDNQINQNSNYNQQSDVGSLSVLNQGVVQKKQRIPGAPYEPSKTMNVLCVIAFVFSFIVQPIGLILGLIGVYNCDKKGEGGRNYGVAAIIISIALPLLIYLIINVSFYIYLKGDSEPVVAVREACVSLDEVGDYEGFNGQVVCEDYVCKYVDWGFNLTVNCDFFSNED